MTLRIGTRGSALAMVQARIVAEALDGGAELVVIRTAGDRSDRPIMELGDGAFVTAIEDALRAGDIDLAVHSLKDLPTEDRPGLVLGAIMERADPRDVLVTRERTGLAALPQGAVVGTSSPRRAAFVRALRPDVVTRDIRGNVDTRLRKVQDGEFDAAVLARAGLDRLGLAVHVEEILDIALCPPAPGQGALAVQCRAGDRPTLERLRAVDHADTRAAVTAERAALRELGASCEIPFGAYGRVEDGEVVLDAALVTERGIRRARERGADPVEVGRRAARAVAATQRMSGTVILTRERVDELLRTELRARGLEVLETPSVRTEPLADEGTLADSIRGLGPDDLLVLTSAAGVNAVAAAMRGLPRRVRVAAVGPSSAASARAAGLDVVFVGAGDGRSLAVGLPLPRGEVLLARSDRALRDLPELLRQRGARVREVVAYTTVVGLEAYRAAALLDAVARPGTSAVITSPSALEGLLECVSAEHLRRLPLVAIGPSTAAAIRACLDVEPVVSASTSTRDLVAAIVTALSRAEVPA